MQNLVHGIVLPVDSNPYRDNTQKSQPTRSALHNSSPAHEHSSKHKTNGKNTSARAEGAQSISSNSSDSDD